MCALSACPWMLITLVFPTYEKLEDCNVKLQSRPEQEEEAKVALLARIQHLTKLIMISTKVTPTSRFSPHPRPRRRYSFGEEEVCLYILTKLWWGHREHSTNFCINFLCPCLLGIDGRIPYQCFCIHHRVAKVCLLILQLAYLKRHMCSSSKCLLLLQLSGVDTFGVWLFVRLLILLLLSSISTKSTTG